MQPFRFIHAADLHLDSPFRGLSALPGAIRERLRESTFGALERLVRLSLEQKADFVVIAGDVYDAADRSLRAQIRFQQAAEQWAGYGIPVFVVHGNHDPQDGRAARLRWPETVRFFGCDRVEGAPVATPDRGTVAFVYGISYGTAAVTDNLAVRFEPADAAPFRIGLLHANVDGDPAHDNYAPCRMRDMLGKPIDYWALGHVHTRQILHAAKPYIVYPGNIQGRHAKECGEKGCYVVHVDGTGEARLDFHELGTVRWHQSGLSIAGLETEQQLKELLEDELERLRAESEGRASVVRLRLEGRGPLHAALRQGLQLEELAAELRAKEARNAEKAADYPFVWIESVVDRTGAEVDMAALAEQTGFLGDMLRIGREIGEDPARLNSFCSDALAPMRSHPGLNKWLRLIPDEERREWLAAAEELAVDLLAGSEEERAASERKSGQGASR